jgi:L-alanine-DL-glutamate epimerase-like enolase superfamily enzyme
MSLWARLADLPLRIEDYALERLERDVSSEFHRVSTVIRLRGDGTDGVGEDVTYDAEDHDVAQGAGAVQPLAGDWTLGSFCDHLATLDLWPQPPTREPSLHYRVWAYESAALDLALRQAGRPLHEVLGREPRPVRFVVSLRLGSPPSLDPLRGRLDHHPGLQFKLDPTPDWDDDLVRELAATGAVESVDFKGYYKGSVVDVPADPPLYRRVLAALPDAWIEDPHDDPEIEALLAGHTDRVSYDAPIHSIADIESLPIAPRMVNVKPSRLGGLRPLLAAYEHCEANGIGMYGGGQFELGPGRGQIQYLASLFHADGPNDVAPGGYNDPHPGPGLPDSPLPVTTAPTGFRWEPAA